MPDRPSARIFISYSRKDGAVFAGDLRKRLFNENLSIWQDLIALEGGRDWWSQIEATLKSKALQHFVLVITPGALASPVVRREIRLARQEGKTVSPVKGPGLKDLYTLPRWIGHVYDTAIPEQYANFIRVLHGPSNQNRVAMMAPEPPTDFVQRPVEFDSLKKQLLDVKGDAIAITAALRGAGGYGKTTLARKLAHDPDIQDAYFDGILWVELGEKPGNLLSIISDLTEILSGERPGLENVTAAAAKLGEALGDRRVLLVIDDLWRAQDLPPFLQGGPYTTRLVTTRNDHVLPDDALRQPVDAMQEKEALALLAGGLPVGEVAALRPQLAALGARLGEWPQLLKIVNGFLRDRVSKKQKLAQAVAGVGHRLDEKGLVAFDARNEADRTKAVARTIGVSLDLLDDTGRARFGELAVFPEDADIPIGIVKRLWAETGGLDGLGTEDLLNELYDLSLLVALDFRQSILRLHDTVRHFLQHQIGAKKLAALHKSLVQATELIEASSETDPLATRYRYLLLPYHLAAAGEREKLDALLLDPGWLTAKLAATGNLQSLVADYEQYGADFGPHGLGDSQNFIGRTLRLMITVRAHEPRQLLPQLLGRLRGHYGSAIPGFLESARRQVLPPAILIDLGSLTPPSAATDYLYGNFNDINALCLLPDGRLASGSSDNTIRLWDVKRGEQTGRLDGHSDRVTALCMLPDGRLASGSHDKTIRLWDVTSCAETAHMEGHSDWVNALCLMPDGHLASASSDATIRLWDVKTGHETARLEGHSSLVTALSMLSDGRLASGSYDTTIRLWEVRTCTESARIEGHSDWVNALCALPDGRLASGSADTTIRLWNVKTGAESFRLEGHSNFVNALCLLPDGRLASGADDKTILLWDVTTGKKISRLEGLSRLSTLCMLRDGRLAAGEGSRIGLWYVKTAPETIPLMHAQQVNALCLLPEGRLASASHDTTIRLWDVKTGHEAGRLEGHSDWVNALCLMPDGQLASGSSDHTIRLWEVRGMTQTAQIKGSPSFVTAMCAVQDGRLATASEDNAIRLWDMKSGAETARLEGHTGWISALCLLPDGRIASGSYDNTIRLWDVNTGTETFRLGAHSSGVHALCLLSDGQLAWGGEDTGIRLWEVTTGKESRRLGSPIGWESAWVSALCGLRDGRLASGSHRTIGLWDVTTRSEITRLTVDAGIKCIAALPDGRLVAGDVNGRLYWLKIV